MSLAAYASETKKSNILLLFKALITGLPVHPVIKWAFGRLRRKTASGGGGRHKGLVPRNHVVTNGFI